MKVLNAFAWSTPPLQKWQSRIDLSKIPERNQNVEPMAHYKNEDQVYDDGLAKVAKVKRRQKADTERQINVNKVINQLAGNYLDSSARSNPKGKNPAEFVLESQADPSIIIDNYREIKRVSIVDVSNIDRVMGPMKNTIARNLPHHNRQLEKAEVVYKSLSSLQKKDVVNFDNYV